MASVRGVFLSPGIITGLAAIHTYRFLTTAQFARVATISYYYAGEVLRALEGRGCLGYFGSVGIPGQGKTPKVYFLKRRGWELLREEGGYPEEQIGDFSEVRAEATWTPQTYHRLRLLDCFIALELSVRSRPHLQIVRTFLEYRRIKGTHQRETADYVGEVELPEHRIVPDGAFILENTETGRQALFFLEMDMGTERIVAKTSRDTRATIHLKFEQYDRYLTGLRFTRTYAEYGEFRSFLLLFVTYGRDPIENIRAAAADLPERLHAYYRFTIFEEASADFLGPVWKSRSSRDNERYRLVRE